MIFTNPSYGQVLRGAKTMTRRLVQKNDPANKYRPLQRLCVKKSQLIPLEAHIILTEVRREPLGMITFEGARAEGFKTRVDFAVYWLNQHDPKWVEENEDAPESEALRRFSLRHAHKEVWVLTFHLDPTQAPLLLADPARGRGDYTNNPHNALPGEPEAIDAKTQEEYAKDGFAAWKAREAQREASRGRLILEERLRLVRVEAKAAGVDIQRQELSILRRIQSIESKVRKRAA